MRYVCGTGLCTGNAADPVVVFLVRCLDKEKIRECMSWRKNFYVYSLASLYVIKCARQFDMLCMFHNTVLTGVLPKLASSRQGKEGKKQQRLTGSNTKVWSNPPRHRTNPPAILPWYLKRAFSINEPQTGHAAAFSWASSSPEAGQRLGHGRHVLSRCYRFKLQRQAPATDAAPLLRHTDKTQTEKSGVDEWKNARVPF